MSRFALSLAQMPGSIPDLVWWILGIAITLITAGAGVLVRLSSQLQTLRLESLRADVMARLAAIEKDIQVCKKWQEDHEP